MKSKPVFQLLLACALAGLPQAAAAQSAADIFSASSVTWLGVDFTRVKALGETGTVSPVEMVSLFHKINDVVINEGDKYNFREALNKTSVPYDLGAVTKANEGINPDNLLSSSSADTGSGWNEQDIQAQVKTYDLKGEGVGLVFLMELLDKPEEEGVMWVAFLDIPSKKVLLAEKMTGKAQGFGFRNHWARTVYEVINQIKKKKYKEWKNRK